MEFRLNNVVVEKVECSTLKEMIVWLAAIPYWRFKMYLATIHGSPKLFHAKRCMTVEKMPCSKLHLTLFKELIPEISMNYKALRNAHEHISS